MAKTKVKVNVKSYIRRVRTKYGKKRKIIKAHKRLVIRDFDSPSGKEELAKEFFVKRFGRSPEMDKREFGKFKKQLELTNEKAFGSSPTTGDFKPSDVALVENLLKNKQIGQKKKLKEKFSIDLDILEDHSSK